MTTKSVDLEYPSLQDGVSRIRVGLIDVRAANCLEITYDFKRNGYVIEMEKTIEGDGYVEGTGEMSEVAFVPAWNEASPETPAGAAGVPWLRKGQTAQREREVIVEWLRSEAAFKIVDDVVLDSVSRIQEALTDLAAAIERGEHHGAPDGSPD